MNKRFLIPIIIVVLLSIFTFHTTFSNANPKDEILETISNMSLDEKIGQLVISGFYGTTLDENILKLIKENKISGVILFNRNVKDSNTLLSLNNSLKESNKNNKLPLFISVDEEGGSVTRMPKDIKRLPTNKYIGSLNNKDLSYKVGEILGEQLSYFGFNMNFAPVLDINSNSNNPVIGDRSFGNNKDIVASLGTSTMKGIQSKNIISVVKHFPGHGDTSVDSHVNLPVVNYNINRLNSFEFVPFKTAIQNGADAVMVGHILLPKIDNKYPSSMSYEIVTNILRKDLGFNGLVVSDDMTMGAITENYSIEEAAVKSINAGVDLLLVCQKYENTENVLKALKEAVLNGRISKERLDNALYNIISIKKKYLLNKEPKSDITINTINEKITNLFR
ncbi:glycoside hydrolase family 3 [Clostridium baratii]|uniref:beta-N-acetylhexosaminidase n=1 Tax=Clostridium baratii TaxID=1561 RepID=UPI0009A339F9|nr:beta-N-acetylhexosaminidase [Clostridium baratii]OPF51344.1 glycoside hydrolase family 3 [Clostridium baratii]OPF55581.1 glycoside hydrolase family 3 [Clostridium baratii]OPF57040.1 glycoside hydrolase family 3 [Clostridium baratii]OPF60038.1 glycoside hydrolase family 3 [Clostridium baratii]